MNPRAANYGSTAISGAYRTFIPYGMVSQVPPGSHPSCIASIKYNKDIFFIHFPPALAFILISSSYNDS